MTTIRVAKRSRYTSVAKAALNDDRLSFRARGVLVWLLDKPDDWRVDSDAIARHGHEGRDAIRTALRELTNAGYLERVKERNEKGQWLTESVLHEDPIPVEPVGDAAPDKPKPGPEKPSSEPGPRNPASETRTSENPASGFRGSENPAPSSKTETEDLDERLRRKTEKSPPAPSADGPSQFGPHRQVAHALTTLAFQQPIKPVIAVGRSGNSFCAARDLIEHHLIAGENPEMIRAAITAGIKVWTLAGLATAFAQLQGNGKHAPDMNRNVTTDRTGQSGRVFV